MTRRSFSAALAFVFLASLAFTGLAFAAKVMTPKDLVAEAKAKIKNTIDVDKAKELIQEKEGLVVLDVREPSEFDAGHLPMAINIPRGLVEFKIGEKIKDKDAPILVYCKTGGRSSLTAFNLQRMGYTGLYNMWGGFDAWKEKSFPVE
jgi:rhodanese-related sulfurtransferase